MLFRSVRTLSGSVVTLVELFSTDNNIFSYQISMLKNFLYFQPCLIVLLLHVITLCRLSKTPAETEEDLYRYADFEKCEDIITTQGKLIAKLFKFYLNLLEAFVSRTREKFSCVLCFVNRLHQLSNQ